MKSREESQKRAQRGPRAEPLRLQIVRGWVQEEEPAKRTRKGIQCLQTNHSISLHFSFLIGNKMGVLASALVYLLEPFGNKVLQFGGLPSAKC